MGLSYDQVTDEKCPGCGVGGVTTLGIPMHRMGCPYAGPWSVTHLGVPPVESTGQVQAKSEAPEAGSPHGPVAQEDRARDS